MHFIASDAHNTTSRPLRLKQTFEELAKSRGQELARGLLVENPLAVFEGKPLPFVPDLSQAAAATRAGAKKRKRFWFF